MPRPKKETLYSNKNNININNLLSNSTDQPIINLNQTFKNDIGNQLGGKKKLNKKNYSSDNSDDELSVSTGGGDDDEEIEESDDDQSNSDEDEANELDDDDEKGPQDDDIEGSDQEKEKDEESDKESDKGSDDEKLDIGDEETIQKNCYSKYAAEADEVDLEELFAEDDFKLTKTARLSKPILFKYEKVRLLSTRAKQLANGAKPMIKNTEGLSSKEIALLELKNKLIPMIIERPIPNSGVERWKLSELEIIDYN